MDDDLLFCLNQVSSIIDVRNRLVNEFSLGSDELNYISIYEQCFFNYVFTVKKLDNLFAKDLCTHLIKIYETTHKEETLEKYFSYASKLLISEDLSDESLTKIAALVNGLFVNSLEDRMVEYGKNFLNWISQHTM